MKKLILLTAILASYSALACPNLSGSYSCTQRDNLGGEQSFSMAVKQNGNSFQFSTEGAPFEGYVADGVTTEVDTLGQVLNMTLFCSNNSLVMETEGHVEIPGLEYDMSSKTVMSKKGNVLTQEIETSAMGNTLLTTVSCREI